MNQLKYLLPLLLFAACTGGGGKKRNKNEAAVTIGPYNLNQYQKVVLPQQLDEISGIAWDSATGAIAAVNDEDGKIFFLDPQTGKVIRKLKFGPSSDYEEIFMANRNYYILHSGGALAEYSGTGDTVKRWININSGDKTEYEAAWYNHNIKNFVWICKVCPADQPVMLSQTSSGGEIEVYTRIEIPLRFNRVSNGKKLKFRPSGAAVHPAGDFVYLISSPDNKILMMTMDGEVIAMQQLNPAIFKQPEGICFGPDGTMYISNEASGGNANLLIFKPQNPNPAP